MRKWSKRKKIIVYNLLIVVGLLTGIELTLTWYLNHADKAPSWMFPALLKYYNESDRKIIQYLPECAHYSDDLFYELNPGTFRYSNRDFDNEFFVNSEGFRDDEASLANPKIVVLGDSYAMGWGVNQNETFADIIERRLEKTTLNTGVSSYGTARELHALKKVNMDSVKYVILQYCPNDFNENKQFYIAKDSLVITTKENWKKASDNHVKTTAYYPLKHFISLAPILFGDDEKKAGPRRKTAKRQINISQEHAFLNVLKKTDYIPKHVQIIIFSLESERCTNDFNESVAALLHKDHSSSLHDQMSYMDISGLIGQGERFTLDAHLNKKGHNVIANKLVEHIASLELNNEKKYWYYESGQLGYVCEYKGGVKDGLFKSYWENGEVSRISKYKNGKRHGEEINYTSTGWIFERKIYYNDVLQGPHITYDSLQQVIDSVYH